MDVLRVTLRALRCAALRSMPTSMSKPPGLWSLCSWQLKPKMQRCCWVRGVNVVRVNVVRINVVRINESQQI